MWDKGATNEFDGDEDWGEEARGIDNDVKRDCCSAKAFEMIWAN
jgi:hypothetical protein